MKGVRWALVLATLTALPTARAAEVPPHRLADRALSILRQRCAGCHGGTAVHGKLTILDRAALVATDRKLVVPGDPDASALLTRVRTGSMPPGKHAKLSPPQVEVLQTWIAAGAPPFSGDDHVLRHILDDVDQLPIRERRTARYLSLDHLLTRPDVVRELGRRRSALEGVLRYFAAKREALLRPVDEAGLVFRIDLRDFGWHQRPLEIVGAPVDERISLLTRYDLLLLEYPFAVLPSDARLATELGQSYYEPSMPVRPIAYLRGDWFAARALDPPLATELRRHSAEVSPPADVPRPDEETASKSPANRRVLPLDRVFLDPDDTAPFDIVATAEQAGEGVAVTVENPTREGVWVEAVHTDGKGRKTVLAPPTLVQAGQKKRFPVENRPGGGAVAADGGRELVTLFVFPEKFERGQVLRGDGLMDRFVHPFYALDDEGRLRDPEADLSRMRVRTVALKVVGDKK